MRLHITDFSSARASLAEPPPPCQSPIHHAIVIIHRLFARPVKVSFSAMVRDLDVKEMHLARLLRENLLCESQNCKDKAGLSKRRGGAQSAARHQRPGRRAYPSIGSREVSRC
jgi:hypothetical protein